MARPTCFRLFWHWARAAASRTFWTAGTNRPIKMAMMAMTTNNSIRVNPLRQRSMGKPSLRKRKKESIEVEVELVTAVRGHFRLQDRLGVVLGRNALLELRGGRLAGNLLALDFGAFAIIRENRDLVRPRNQTLVVGNGVFAVL